MATVRTVTVKSADGDYTSLSNAEAGEQGDLPTLDRQLNIECYSMSDTTTVTIDGWTADSTRYISIYTPVNERHDGKWNASRYRLEPANDGIVISEYYVRITGLQIAFAGGYRNGILCSFDPAQTGDIRIEKNIIKATSSGENTKGIKCVLFTTIYIYNNVIYDCTGGTYSSGVECYNGAVILYNNTFHGCNRGIWAESGTVVAKNTLVQSCTDGYAPIDGNFTGSDYNLTDGTDAPGGNSRNSQDVTFVDENNDDFHLAAGDAGAKNYGVSDPGSGLFSDDIDGQTRSGTWDIGADEYVASSTYIPYPFSRGARGGIAAASGGLQ